MLVELIHIVGQGQRDHIGLEAVNYRTRLFAGAAMRLFDPDILPFLFLPVLGEDRVEVLVKLACGIVGDVQKLDLPRD